jgi:hypothetical protein
MDELIAKPEIAFVLGLSDHLALCRRTQNATNADMREAGFPTPPRNSVRRIATT